MIHAYDEIIDFIAGGTTPKIVSTFALSKKVKERVADLIRREKTCGLSHEESVELNHCLQIEHLMRLAKIRAKAHLRSNHAQLGGPTGENDEPVYRIPQKRVQVFLGLSTVAVGLLTWLLVRKPGLEGDDIVGPVVAGTVAALIYISVLQRLLGKYRK